MTSTTFFIIFIPILAILLLAINLLLAPHNPYQEKDSAFECGFHSFLGQNRTQFSVSFFIFGLLFLLFDLEILLVYPYSVSSYTNDIYGLVIMMVFFVLLTLGFIFELGKNALTIDSRQTFLYEQEEVVTQHVFVSAPVVLIMLKVHYEQWAMNHIPSGRTMGLNKTNAEILKQANALITSLVNLFILLLIFVLFAFIHRPPKHILQGNCLESKIEVFKIIKYNLLGQVKKSISNYAMSILTKKFLPIWHKYPLLYHYFSIINKIIYFITYLYNTLLEHILVRLERKYPFSFIIISWLYIEYTRILKGNLRSQHINFFIILGILLKSTDYFTWLIIMTLADLVKNYIKKKRIYFN